MRTEGDVSIFSVKTPIVLPSGGWEERLTKSGIKDASVSAAGESRVDGEKIVEVRIDSKGVRMTQEVRRRTEAKLRSIMGGQVLQN